MSDGLHAEHLNRSYHPDVLPWEELANAIIVQAVSDYRSYWKELKTCNVYNAPLVKNEIKKIRNFFLSSWFEVLSYADGKEILSALDKEVLETYGCAQILGMLH